MVAQLIIAQKEDKTMTKIDFSPLYRSTVGFDHLASLFDSIYFKSG